MSNVFSNRWKLPDAIVKLGWISFLTDVASEMLYPVVPLFLTSALGAPVAVVGVIEGVAEAIVSIMKGLSGWHCDKMGRRVPYIRWGYGLIAKENFIFAEVEENEEELEKIKKWYENILK